jgi:hypothetical protein
MFTTLRSDAARLSGRAARVARSGRGLLCALALVLPAPASADSLRCDGKLIQVGDPKARLIAACGSPLSREVVAFERAYADGEPVRIETVEEWTYPAPNADGFRNLRFVAGRLVGDGIRCEGALVQHGDTTAAVRKRCGEPITRDSAGLRRTAPGPASPGPVREVALEQWVYDRGPGRPLSIVSLRGGRVTAIENGSRP